MTCCPDLNLGGLRIERAWNDNSEMLYYVQQSHEKG
jgi:hypothetical protein